MLDLEWLGRLEKEHAGRLIIVFYWKVDCGELSAVVFKVHGINW